MKEIIIKLVLVGCAGFIMFLILTHLFTPTLHIPQFKAGDCIILNNDLEVWENPNPIFKVLFLGQKKYRLEFMTPGHLKGTASDTYFTFDDIYKKVDCPKD